MREAIAGLAPGTADGSLGDVQPLADERVTVALDLEHQNLALADVQLGEEVPSEIGRSDDLSGRRPGAAGLHTARPVHSLHTAGGSLPGWSLALPPDCDADFRSLPP